MPRWSMIWRTSERSACRQGFDEFTPGAAMYGDITGTRSEQVEATSDACCNVAMASNNFYGLRIEWWHFTTADWKKYVPDEQIEKTNPGENVTTDEKVKAAAPKPDSKS